MINLGLALDGQKIALQVEVDLRLLHLIQRRGNDTTESHIVNVFDRDTEDPGGGIEDEFAIFEGDFLNFHQGSGLDIAVIAINIQSLLCV